MGIAVYPVNAGGLLGMSEAAPSLDASYESKILNASTGALLDPNLHTVGRTRMDQRAQAQINGANADMIALAERTGGQASLNSNDVSGAIRRAMDDTQVTYVLYYTPSHDQWDGTFRDIKINLNRPGLEAHYRTGYYAISDSPNDPKARQAVLATAGTSPLVATGLTIVAKLTEKPTAAEPHALVRVVLDGHEIGFTRNAQAQPDATLDIALFVFGDQPTPLHQTGHPVHLAMKQEQYQKMLQDGVSMTLDVDSPVQAQRVRVVVRDLASGQVGSVDVPIK